MAETLPRGSVPQKESLILLKITVFWNVLPCSLKVASNVAEEFCLQLLGRKIRSGEKERYRHKTGLELVLRRSNWEIGNWENGNWGFGNWGIGDCEIGNLEIGNWEIGN